MRNIKLKKGLILSLIIFVFIFVLNALINFSSNSTADNVYSKTPQYVTKNEAEYKTGDYKYNVDKSQMIYFAIRFVDHNWNMNDLSFPNDSMSAIDYDSEAASSKDVIVGINYANQTFYLYDEYIRGHHREYQEYLFGWIKSGFSPYINVVRCNDGYEYAGYSIHKFNTLQTGLVPYANQSDIVDPYLTNINISTNTPSTKDKLFGYTRGATLGSNTSILLNLYFYKPVTYTISVDLNAATIGGDEENDTFTFNTIPYGSKLTTKYNSDKNSYNLLIEGIEWEIKDNDTTKINKSMSTTIYVKEGYTVDINEKYAVTFEGKHTFFKTITSKPIPYTVQFNVVANVSALNCAFFACIGDAFSEAVYPKERGLQTLTFTIENVPCWTNDSIKLYYKGRYSNIDYGNYAISSEPITKLNELVEAQQKVEITENIEIKGDYITQDVLGYITQYFYVGFDSHNGTVSGLPEGEYVELNGKYVVPDAAPQNIPEGYIFNGYTIVGSNSKEEEFTVRSNITLHPLFKRNVEVYFKDYDGEVLTYYGEIFIDIYNNESDPVWTDLPALPSGKGMNNYAFNYWYEEPVTSPTKDGVVKFLADIIPGHTYYGSWIALGDNHRVTYLINTNEDVKGFTTGFYTDGYSSYYFIDENDNLNFYSNYKIIDLIPEATDGNFLGWTDVKGSSEVKYDTNYTFENIYGDLTLYAVWERKEVTSYLSLDGGLINGEDIREIKGYVGDTITLTSPIKQGYTFVSYSFEDGHDINGKLNSITSAGIRTYTYTFGNIPDYIKASYKVNEYAISVKLDDLVKSSINVNISIYVDGELVKEETRNSGYTSSIVKYANYGSTVNLVITINEDKYGLSFDEYSNIPTKKLEYEFVLSDENILKTVYISQLYTISFNKNGADNDATVSSIYKIYNQNIDITDVTNPFVLANKENDGWSTSKDGSSGKITLISTNANVTLYSYWLNVINFYTGDDEIYTSIHAYKTQMIDIPETPIKDGYTFGGWTQNQDGYTSYWSNGQKNASTVNWYATWIGTGTFELQEVYHKINVKLYGYDVDFNSYKYTMCDNVTARFNYNFTKSGSYNYANAIKTNQERIEPIKLPMLSNNIVGYNDDPSSLDIKWTTGEIEIHEDYTWYAIYRYVENVVKETTTLTHTFYLSNNSTKVFETKVESPISGDVTYYNYDKTISYVDTSDTNYGSPSYSELEYYDYSLENYNFMGWASDPNSIDIEWDYSGDRRKVLTEDTNFYAVYCLTVSKGYNEDTTLNHVFHINEEESFTVETTRTYYYDALYYTNYNAEVKVYHQYIDTVVDQEIEEVNYQNIEVKDENLYLIGWIETPNIDKYYYYYMWEEKDGSKSKPYGSEWYAIYQDAEHNEIDKEDELSYYFYFDEKNTVIVNAPIYYINSGVSNVYNYTLNDKIKIDNGEFLKSDYGELVFPSNTINDKVVIGWSNRTDTIEDYYDGSSIIASKNINFYAVYQLSKEVKVKFDLPEEFDNIDQVLTVYAITNYNGKLYESMDNYLTLPIVTQARGYIFKNYSDSKDNTTIYEENKKIFIDYYSLEDDELILYGIVEKLNEYSIKNLDTNEEIRLFHNETYTIPNVVNIPEHYDFVCWTINGDLYNTGDVLTITNSMVLTPIFNEHEKFEVLFTNENITKTYYINEKLVLGATSIPENYIFKGYDVNGTIYQVGDSIEITSNLIIEAIFEEVPSYIISFVDDGTNKRYYSGEIIVLGEAKPQDTPFLYYNINGRRYSPGDAVEVNENLTIDAIYESDTKENKDSSREIQIVPIVLFSIGLFVIVMAVIVFVILMIKKRKTIK